MLRLAMLQLTAGFQSGILQAHFDRFVEALVSVQSAVTSSPGDITGAPDAPIRLR